MLGLRPGNAEKCWRERGSLHGKTHIHMQEHVSTLRNVPWTHGKTSAQAAQDAQISPAPLAGILGLPPVEGEAYPGERASPDLCQGC